MRINDSLHDAVIRGVIFDLDGTLYHMKWFMGPMLALMLFPHSIRLQRYMRVRKHFAGKEMLSEEKLLWAIAEKLSGKHTKENGEKIVAWIRQRFYPAFENVMPLLQGSRPGLVEVLCYLKDRDIKIAVLSDFAHIKERLRGLNLQCDLFDIIKSSESCGALKPHPRPFLEIADAWNVAPANVLVIGDRHDTDGIAAENAQMHFLQITDKKKRELNPYLWYHVKEFLGSLNGSIK